MASPGSVSADWLNWGLTNSQILGTESLPTIIEMETSPHARRFHRALRNFWAIWGSIGQGHGEYEMWRLKLLQHIDTRLPGPVASGRDVFLVCRSRITNGNIRIDAPSKHWSVYSQGHFYHLSAPTKPRRLWGMSQKSSANTHVDSQLKHEDLSNRETLDYQRLQSATIRPVPLIAYKVGQTHYSPNEIFSLAEWVMQRMSTYDLFTANCQVYALRLLARIVMRLSDRSSFVGTAIQIAEWDLQTESPHEGYKTIATGFHVHVPRPRKTMNLLYGRLTLSRLQLHIPGYKPYSSLLRTTSAVRTRIIERIAVH